MCMSTKEKKHDRVEATTEAIATQPLNDTTGELFWDRVPPGRAHVEL